MNKILLPLVLLLPLSGCATVNAMKPTQKQISLVITKCPVLKQYSREELKKAAAEIAILPTEAQVTKMIGDYGKLRDACRVISKRLKK